MTVTDELLAELEEITSRQPGALLSVRSSSMNLIYSELRRLRAENAELAKDAGRYRWVKELIDYNSWSELAGHLPDEWDDYIDAAMATQ